MTLLFDHIIYFSEDPAAMKTQYYKEGFHTVTGGTHDVWGTHNTLLHCGLSYIEFLGIKNRQTFESYNDSSVDYTLMSSIYKENYRIGMHNFALRTTDIDALSMSLVTEGFEVDGPHKFNRQKEDDKIVSWKLLFVKDNKTNVPMPFIIDWGMSDDERLENLKKTNVLGDNGELVEIKNAVSSKSDAMRVFKRAFHLKKMNEETLILGNVKLTFSEALQENQALIMKDGQTFVL
ncbi:VOC family protein [Phocicoccus pinnipedialis]|uniref:Glyoxalase-like domain-containing protein n=1 Tax=Phocicoccus pinnipedialis TaxID=110845 RepID=A0A6V7R5J1_9BACL|nr:VOC family protein [Jeotgalicoccus pinnipedialis]MBP1939692.1 hypothetical protein [Jeotgalicoccus pinnipedialis]CAD2072314.1 hypothetical protein JEOPIN946_00412 [Jeotgalicoccus pinnipedialis]